MRATAMLAATMGEAIKTLLELLKGTFPHTTQLGTARSILDLATKMRQDVELEERRAALEQRMDGGKPPGFFVWRSATAVIICRCRPS